MVGDTEIFVNCFPGWSRVQGSSDITYRSLLSEVNAQFSPVHSAKRILRVLQGGKATEPEEETKRKQGEKVLRKVR